MRAPRGRRGLGHRTVGCYRASYQQAAEGRVSILIYILDYAFPILLQLMRIPLLAARLLGDGIELFLEGVVRCLPMSRAKREAWRARVRQQWIWFRHNISYQAFEHA